MRRVAIYLAVRSALAATVGTPVLAAAQERASIDDLAQIELVYDAGSQSAENPVGGGAARRNQAAGCHLIRPCG